MKQFLKNIFYIKCIIFEKFFPSNKGHILMYHSFNLIEVFFNVSFDDFKKQMHFLQQHNYHVVPLVEFLERKGKGLSLKKYVTITFDDGYAGLGEVAQFLHEEKIPKTIFWPSGVLEDTLRLSNGVEYKILSHGQLHEILEKYSGITLGSHGVTHRELTKISHDDLVNELVQSKKDIESLPRAISVIAYPRGKYNQKVIDATKEAGYTAGLTTKEGGVDAGTELFELPRLTADCTVDMLAFEGKLTRLYDWYKQIF